MKEFSLLSPPAKEHWLPFATKPLRGVLLPLFSLRSQANCSIGEYLDLLPFLSFLKKAKLNCLQLLPLNDTHRNPSPYSAFCSFALNPLHISISKLPGAVDHPAYHRAKQESSYLKLEETINYPNVIAIKERFFESYLRDSGKEIAEGKEYIAFIEENPWVEEYALFKTLCERGVLVPYHALSHHPLFELRETIRHHSLLQFLAYQQLKLVKKRAESLGISIVGDLPILLNRESFPLWRWPSLFREELCAGAPPDMYAPKGQAWGFPIYDWERKGEAIVQFWSERLKRASHFYDLYRLDHAVGFYRLFAIPKGENTAEKGKYIPFDEKRALLQGEKTLRALLKSSPLLPIAEDLGAVPESFRENLGKLAIPTTKVLRWERIWNEPDQPFIPLEDYPEGSMITLSTHDSTSFADWWENNPEESHPLAKNLHLEARPIFDHDLRKQLMILIEDAPSQIKIHPITEYFGLDPDFRMQRFARQRINTPSTVGPHNWSLVMPLSVEDLEEHDYLAKSIADLAYVG